MTKGREGGVTEKRPRMETRPRTDAEQAKNRTEDQTERARGPKTLGTSSAEGSLFWALLGGFCRSYH